MSNEVYANGRELSCKSGSGKSICAFPDVCLTPPPPPAGPIPVPYPNTGMTTDTSDGSKSVEISGKEVMLKDSSCFKTSTGDEAATKSQGMNVITHQIQGKCYFTSWSMDVKIEGENAVRHLDMMTHNHASGPGATPPWPFIDQPSSGDIPECQANDQQARDDCLNATPPGMTRDADGRVTSCSDACARSQKCILVKKDDDKEFCCPPAVTGHHLVEDNCFSQQSGRSPARQVATRADPISAIRARLAARGMTFQLPQADLLPGFGNYVDTDAPTMCAATSVGDTDHGALHAITNRIKAAYRRARPRGLQTPWNDGGDPNMRSHWTYDEASDAGAKAGNALHPHCSEACLKAQLDAYHVDELGIDPDDPVRTDLSQTYTGGEAFLARGGAAGGQLDPGLLGRVTQMVRGLRFW